MLLQFGFLSFLTIACNVLAIHTGKRQHKSSHDDLESIAQLVQESTALQSGMRNLEQHLTEYRVEIGNLTTDLQLSLTQFTSSLRGAQQRLTLAEITEAQRRHRENFENRINQLQTRIDEQDRILRERLQQQIEEFTRMNQEILRAREELSEGGS